jgi:hypothetical protein
MSVQLQLTDTDNARRMRRMNRYLLEEPVWLDAALVTEEWDGRRLAFMQRGELVAMLLMGIDPPKRKNPARCLLWVQTHSGQTRRRLGAGADVGPPKSIFLGVTAAENIRPRSDDTWHEAEFELILPESESVESLR